MTRTTHFGALAAVAGATLVAVGLVVLMVLVVEVRPAEATFPGENGRIAVVHANRNFWTIGIYTIKPGGGGRFHVTNIDSSYTPPDYSPDGKKIAYSASDGHDGEIFTMNVTGGKPFQVTDNKTDDGQPSWRSQVEHEDQEEDEEE